jgi:hypothetical protein
MAKKSSRQQSARQDTTASRAVVDFAEDLGRLLGTARAKASNWLNQRQNVIDELTELRDTANQLLNDLVGGATPRGRAQRGTTRGRPVTAERAAAQAAAPSSARKGRRRKMSAAARREVSQRMRRYWAARRKAKAARS